MTRFEKFTAELSKDTPIKIKYKNNSIFMIILSFILFFNKDFISLYCTTIGNSVYYPTKNWVDKHDTEALLVISHEYVHIKDNIRMGKLYSIAYLFPQILSLFSIFSVFAFINPFAWFFILFLIFLAPLPAPGRKNIEMKGYKMTLYTLYLLYSERKIPLDKILLILYKNVEIMNVSFTGSGYYFMWPFGVQKELRLFVDEMLINEPVSHEYRIVKDALKISKY